MARDTLVPTRGVWLAFEARGSYLIQGYIHLVSDCLDVFDFWQKTDPIYAGLEGGFDAQFKVRNNCETSRLIDNVAIALVDQNGDNFDCYRRDSSVSIDVGDTDQTGFQSCTIDSPGEYQLIAKLNIDGDWSHRAFRRPERCYPMTTSLCPPVSSCEPLRTRPQTSIRRACGSPGFLRMRPRIAISSQALRISTASRTRHQIRSAIGLLLHRCCDVAANRQYRHFSR